jgi:hypothetical protein
MYRKYWCNFIGFKKYSSGDTIPLRKNKENHVFFGLFKAIFLHAFIEEQSSKNMQI